MSNSYLTITQVTRKYVQLLENNLVFTRMIDRQYDDRFGVTGAKIGASLTVRKPRRSLVTDGAALAVADYSEESGIITITNQPHIDTSFTGADLQLSMDDFSYRVAEPDASQLAAYIDNLGATNLYKKVYNSVGTPGTTPATSLVLGQAMQKLDETGTPRSQRFCTVNPAANTGLVEGLKGLLNPSGTISKQFRTGMMGMGVLGFEEIAMTQSMPTHTTGNWGTTITVTTTVSTQGQATLGISFTGSSKTWKEGDVFTIQDVYAVNPQTRVSTGSLQQFVVTEDLTASSTGTLKISPPLYTAAHKLATVDSFPASTKAITMVGTAATAYPQNLVFHTKAFTMASADNIMPEGVHMGSRIQHAGMSFRIVSQYDINNDRYPTRIGDGFVGWQSFRPEMACRIWG